MIVRGVIGQLCPKIFVKAGQEWAKKPALRITFRMVAAGEPSSARSCPWLGVLDEIAAHTKATLGIIIPALEA
jgi:hypothetical protein